LIKQKAVLVFSILIAVVLLTGVAYSAGFTKNIEVTFYPLKYYFDGVQRQAPDGQSGFIYNGTTYVPLRFVSEALGKEVGWEGSSYSIYVGEQPGGEIVYLSDMRTLTSTKHDAEFVTSFKTNMGEQYYNAFWTYSYDGYIRSEYVVDGKYKKFQALLAPEEDWSSTRKEDNLGHLALYGDGKKIYESGPIPSDITTPIKVDVDLTGVLKLKVILESEELDGFGLIDAKLIK